MRRMSSALAPALAAAGVACAALAVFRRSAASVPPPPPAGAGAGAGACELIVVRHGETEWNRALRVQGSTDIELNGKGRTQAERCAEALAARFPGPSAAPGVVWSSQLGRAAVTASAIAAALAARNGITAADVRRDARLNEWDLGVLEGLRKEEAAERHAEDWSAFSDNWSAPRVGAGVASRVITGGESMLQVRARAVACLEEACREAREAARGSAGGSGRAAAVVAVTHGGVIGQLMQHAVAQGGAEEAAVSDTPVNACISRFLVAPGGRWRVVDWARTDHLTGEAAPVSANYDATPVPS